MYLAGYKMKPFQFVTARDGYRLQPTKLYDTCLHFKCPIMSDDSLFQQFIELVNWEIDGFEDTVAESTRFEDFVIWHYDHLNFAS